MKRPELALALLPVLFFWHAQKIHYNSHNTTEVGKAVLVWDGDGIQHTDLVYVNTQTGRAKRMYDRATILKLPVTVWEVGTPQSLRVRVLMGKFQ